MNSYILKQADFNDLKKINIPKIYIFLITRYIVDCVSRLKIPNF